MSQINISNLTFAYEGSYDNIFTDVSFSIDTDWKLGFCGRNGRGKTTFLKLLMGKYEFHGSITASVNFEYFPFEISDPSEITMEIMSTIAPDAQLWQFQKEFSQLAVDESALYRPFSTLSNGERTKVLLCGLFLRKNSFLLIDEPTNHLDMEARKTVAQYLNSKDGFILVSHDRMFLDECIDHMLSINKTNIDIQSGNFSSWFTNKQRQDDYELAENERLRKDISRLESAARRTSAWSDRSENRKIGFDPTKTEKSKGRRAFEGEKSRKMMTRSKSIQDRQQRGIEEKSKLLRNIESAEALKIHSLKYHTSRLLTAENVSVSYDGNSVFDSVSFTIEQRERLTLLGGNGSGKSSLIKLICGEDIPHRGTIGIGNNLIISYVPQDASFLSGSLDEYADQQNIDVTLFKTILRKLDFSRVQFEKGMHNYSAGQKKKVLIARSLCQSAHLYVWDEPLNYIDVLSRIQIEHLIKTHAPTLLFVEHDRAFCENIATKTIQLRKS